MKKAIFHKTKTFLILGFSLLLFSSQAQFTISPMFRAGNFWMPGDNEHGFPNLDVNFNGDLQKYVSQMKASGITHIP